MKVFALMKITLEQFYFLNLYELLMFVCPGVVVLFSNLLKHLFINFYRVFFL